MAVVIYRKEKARKENLNVQLMFRKPGKAHMRDFPKEAVKIAASSFS